MEKIQDIPEREFQMAKRPVAERFKRVFKVATTAAFAFQRIVFPVHHDDGEAQKDILRAMDGQTQMNSQADISQAMAVSSGPPVRHIPPHGGGSSGSDLPIDDAAFRQELEDKKRREWEEKLKKRKIVV